MEINSAAQMRQAIIELAQRVDKIEEWQAMDAELAGGEFAHIGGHPIPGHVSIARRAVPMAAPETLADRIADRYDHLRARLPFWKDAINLGDRIEAPLVVSKVTPGWTPTERAALVEAAPHDFVWFRQPPPEGSSYSRTYRPGTDMPWIRYIVG